MDYAFHSCTYIACNSIGYQLKSFCLYNNRDQLQKELKLINVHYLQSIHTQITYFVIIGKIKMSSSDEDDDDNDMMLLLLLKEQTNVFVDRFPCRTSAHSGKEYIREVVYGNPIQCYESFRMKPHVFLNLCDKMKQLGLLKDSRIVKGRYEFTYFRSL